MGFENIRRRYDDSKRQQYNTSTQESPSLARDVLSLVVQSFLWAYVFVVETFRLVLDIVEEFLDYPWRFLKYSYVGGGFFYALLQFAPKIEELFSHFSVGDLFSLAFGIAFLSVLWFIDLITQVQIPWIVYIMAVLAGYCWQKRSYTKPPIVFWIWSGVVLFIYILFFMKFI